MFKAFSTLAILLIWLGAPLGLIAQESSVITVKAVGDMMLGSHYPSSSYLPNKESENVLQYIKDSLMADILFGNMEGVLLDEGPTTKRCSDPSKCYAFKMPTRYADFFAEAGFDLLSLANNHVNDFGTKGRDKSRELLEQKGIKHAGLQTHPSWVGEINGIKVGFAAFSPNNATSKFYDTVRVKQIVKKLASEADLVIFSFHGGAEGSKHEHVTGKREIFYGEDRGNVKRLARMAVESGADLVFGHGPHVTRAMEYYRGRLIAYSLGNFATYGRFNLSGPNGIAPILEVKVSDDGRFVGGRIIPTYQAGKGVPKYDSQKRVIEKLRALNNADFPNGKLVISPDGSLSVKQ